jgi:hypothetical protein
VRRAEQEASGYFKRFGPEQKEFNSSDLDELRYFLRREVGPQKWTRKKYCALASSDRRGIHS